MRAAHKVASAAEASGQRQRKQTSEIGTCTASARPESEQPALQHPLTTSGEFPRAKKRKALSNLIFRCAAALRPSSSPGKRAFASEPLSQRLSSTSQSQAVCRRSLSSTRLCPMRQCQLEMKRRFNSVGANAYDNYGPRSLS